jgi:hypothetical protein
MSKEGLAALRVVVDVDPDASDALWFDRLASNHAASMLDRRDATTDTPVGAVRGGVLDSEIDRLGRGGVPDDRAGLGVDEDEGLPAHRFDQRRHPAAEFVESGS